MIAKITFDDGIDKFISGAQNAGKQSAYMEYRIVKQAGIAGLENVASNIHSRSGKLAQSFTVGGTENVFDINRGVGNASVRYGSNCPYAIPVEEGYSQLNRVNKKSGKKPSLWIPGNGSGKNFTYRPKEEATGGMLLSGRFVPGQHMFEKSIPDTQEDIKKICKSEVERLFKALF